MKSFFLLCSCLFSLNALACPDLSGSYLDTNEESIVLSQKGCGEVTVLSRPFSHTLILNNEYVLVQEDADLKAFGRGIFQQEILVLEVRIEYKRSPGIPRILLPVRAVNKYSRTVEGNLMEVSTVFNDNNGVLTNTKTIYRQQ